MSRLSLLSRMLVLVSVLFASSMAQAVPVDLSGALGTNVVITDHFPGTTLNAQWTATVSGTGSPGIVVGTDYPSVTTVELYSAGGNTTSGPPGQTKVGTTAALNYGATTTDWWAQVTFLMPVQSGGWVSTNGNAMYRLLSGEQTNSPTVAGLVQGIDLRLIRAGNQLFSLGWYGDDDAFRTADILADNGGFGFAFSNTQKYTVSMHRKPDNNVDIYFDSTTGDGSTSEFLFTKPLILGANPDGLIFGDWSSTVRGYLLVDQIRLEATPVPEPSGFILASIGFGFIIFRRRHQSKH